MTRRRIILMLITLFIFIWIVYFFAPIFQPTPKHKGDELRVAVWMGVTWSMDEHNAGRVEQLTNDLISQQVDDVYVYVSYLKPDDFFNPTYDHAKSFIQTLKTFAPDIRVMAWVGVPISITQSDGQPVANRLESKAIREQIAEFSVFVVNELGFDGLHLNAELIPNDDRAFIETLKLIQETLPETTIFSTTAHALRLDRAVTASPYPVMPHHWTSDYLREVAEYVDQIVLMAYDSGLFLPSDYKSWMTYQVETSAQALQNPQTELLIGITTSEEWTPSHQTQAETLSTALQGFHTGYMSRIDGIAIYPYWDTSVHEWNVIIDFLVVVK